MRGGKRTTDITDSGYDTTAASILAQKKDKPKDKNINASIKTLVAMSKFKQKISSMGDQAAKTATTKEKDGRKKKIKQVIKTKERTFKHTKFSNLIDRRPRRRKDRLPIVPMNTIREIEILPTRFHKNTHDTSYSL